MPSTTFQRVATTKSIVTLSGGRRYMISPGDISNAVCWLPGTRVEIEDSDDPVYRFIILREDYPHDELRANPL